MSGQRVLPADVAIGSSYVYRSIAKYDGVVVTILRGREPDRQDRFGRPLMSWWARREDTGEEGFLDFGAGLAVLPLEDVGTLQVIACSACDLRRAGRECVGGGFSCVSCRDRSPHTAWKDSA